MASEFWNSPLKQALPQKGYQDNPDCLAVIDWHEDKVKQAVLTSENFYKHLNPLEAPASSLDWLSYVTGMFGRYWSLAWSEGVKRAVLDNAWTNLIPRRGTVGCIAKLLDIHSIEASIWQGGTRPQLPVKLPFQFEVGGDLELTVRLPSKYHRRSYQFIEAVRIVDVFSPAICKAQVAYEQWTFGVSKLGEPLFYDQTITVLSDESGKPFTDDDGYSIGIEL